MTSGKIKRLRQATRIGWKLLDYKFTSRKRPLMVCMLLTNTCNLKCFYCFAQTFNRQIKNIPAKEWIALIDELDEMGTEIIGLLGGEPLLYEGIDEIVDHVSKKGMLCELVTNGLLVKEKRDVLKKVDSICVSIDGDEENHDRNRGKGSYKKALEAIEEALSLGLNVRGKSIVTKHTARSVEHLLNLAKNMGFSQTYGFPSIHTEHEDLTLPKEQAMDVVRSLIKYKRAGYPVAHSFTSLKYMLNWPYGFHDIISETPKDRADKDILPCVRKDISCFVDANGMVYPCGQVWDNFRGKNLRETGFKTAWEHLKNTECYSCGFLGEMDINLIMSLSAENVLEAATYYFLGRIGRKKNLPDLEVRSCHTGAATN